MTLQIGMLPWCRKAGEENYVSVGCVCVCVSGVGSGEEGCMEKDLKDAWGASVCNPRGGWLIIDLLEPPRLCCKLHLAPSHTMCPLTSGNRC